ncbi:MAG: type III-B CRISPR-associated protein Cas10/Cmr2 [Chloroflexota bacterium]|nr:type III-B CRISPR-associated protein Cas10/Cmr2 [Chloroflexota bacterium]
MSEAILIFSLGPVQGFISEARRVGDLDAGSEVLKRLSSATGQAIRVNGGTLIYPAHLEDDVPNKLVARVPREQIEDIIIATRKAVKSEWQIYMDKARNSLARHGPPLDQRWNAIWERQTDTFWETYWAAAHLDHDYKSAYGKASRAFDATKRTRVFPQVEEQGLKDSLGGRRSALRTADLRADEYWAQVAASPRVTQAQLRPQGRERLDALGAVKRWGELAEKSPSVSHIAAADFLAAAKDHSSALGMYRRTIEDLLGDHCYPVSNDPDWPYDGDLFFPETLTENRLADSYALSDAHGGYLEAARDALRALHRKVNHPLSSYCAVIVFDGDRIGEMVSKCETEEEHRAFSQRLLDFARQAREFILECSAHPVYVGGDDVLALAPLSKALPLVQTLVERFEKIVEGTASAGIAIAHHLHPLDATLSAARAAEQQAKNVEDKASVCMRVLRRSGEQFDVRSRWDDLNDFEPLVNFFRDGALSSRLPYAVAEWAYAFEQPGDAFEAELRRLLGRHHDPKRWTESEAEWAERLRDWAQDLPQPMGERYESSGQTEELARWLVLARFLAQGGIE